MENIANLFEGPEKKLEIILLAPQADIRENKNGRWNKVITASRAEIISQASTSQMDAYLLSESSLFVWEDRVLMITCGQTTLVQAIGEILKIVGRKNVGFVFYEQKNFLFPNEQPSDFKKDVACICKYFPGKYYKLGPVNYDHVNIFYWSHAEETPAKDATLQLLMHDLDPQSMNVFCKNYIQTSVQAENASGLNRLYPRKMIMDGYLFLPCGYSLNAIVDESYFTVHVTPQTSSSYVSFETNIFEADYCKTIGQVISIFQPGRFSLVLTTSMDKICLTSHKTLANAAPDYRISDKSLYELDCGYSVTFLNYTKDVK